jgi:flagellar basal-body rod protein FlgC
MGMFAALQAASSGMNVFKTWIDTTANNVANMNSVSLTPGGEPFRTQLVIAQANDDQLNNPGAHVVEISAKAEEVAGTEYDPMNPLADPVTGEVKKPGVDMGEQMVNLIAAQRGYQANVSVLQQARDAYQAALRLH